MYAGTAVVLLATFMTSLGLLTTIPDGLIVTKNENVRTVATEYEVLIVIQPPVWPPELTKAIARVRRRANDMTGPAMLTREDTSMWLKRLDRLKPTLDASDSSTNFRIVTRQKRGLINFVGKISKTLFGTATSEDVERIGRILQQSSKEQSKIVHRVNDLLTIVNHSRTYINETRDRVNLVTRHLGEAFRGLRHLGHAINNLSDNQRFIRQNLLIERAIDGVEASAQEIQRQEEHYKTQKMALEAERLTQDVLSERDLKLILAREETDTVHVIKPLQWYYEYCKVEPIWTMTHLAYRVVLPLVTKNPVTMYNLKAFPQYGNESDVVIKLQVADMFAEDLMTGDVLRPYQCQGHSPVVCKNNIREKGLYYCEKAIIQGDKRHYGQCTVLLSRAEVSRRPHPLPSGEYVLSSPGEFISVRCRLHPPKKLSLSRGVFLINVEENCMYEGHTWRLYGIRRTQSEYKLAYTLLDLPTINIPTLLAGHVNKFVDETANLEMLSPVKTVSLKPLQYSGPRDSDFDGLLSNELSTIDICIFVLMMPLYFFICFKIYRKCKTIYHDKQESKKVDKHELEPNAPNAPSETVEEQAIDNYIKSIYPRLPTVNELVEFKRKYVIEGANECSVNELNEFPQ